MYGNQVLSKSEGSPFGRKMGSKLALVNLFGHKSCLASYSYTVEILLLILTIRNEFTTMLEIEKKCSLNITLLNVLPYELWL